MEPVYIKKFRIDISDIDFKKRLKLGALFDFCQNIADLAAEDLGVGVSSLAERFGVAWILSRMRVDLFATPSLYEELLIETWPIRHGRLTFERDFIIYNSSGAAIAAAVSSWVLMDIATREIKKADFIGDTPSCERTRAIDCRLRKIMAPAEMTHVYDKVIGYSDIDFNGHINNSKYVGYAMDCFTMDFHRLHAVCSIELDYINETLPGDVLILNKSRTQETSGGAYIEGLSANSGKDVFRALIRFGSASDFNG